MRPTTPTTITKGSKIIARFCNQSKLDDQNTIWTNMKTAQKINARIVITIGMKGLLAFSFVIETSIISFPILSRFAYKTCQHALEVH
jgi:hypothetical protein